MKNPSASLGPGISLFAIYNNGPCATGIYNTIHKYIYSALRPFVHPRQVMLPEGLPEGNTNCRGWTNRHISLVQGQHKLFYYTGPSCSKLTMSLVNDSLKFTSSDTQICRNFLLKNVSSFCNAKATHIFSAKNIRILCIESAKTVNEMTLKELVKLTTLWTTGPWILSTSTALKVMTSPEGNITCEGNISGNPDLENITLHMKCANRSDVRG